MAADEIEKVNKKNQNLLYFEILQKEFSIACGLIKKTFIFGVITNYLSKIELFWGAKNLFELWKQHTSIFWNYLKTSSYP